ncbi:hypothetical protein Tco_0664172 [Tanacetum coccineum]
MYQMNNTMNPDHREVFEDVVHRHEMEIVSQERISMLEEELESHKSSAASASIKLVFFDVGTLTGDEVFAEQEVPAKCVNLTVDEVTLAQVLADLKSVKPKVKRDVIKELSVPISAASASIKVSAAITKTAIIPTPRKGIVITELEITLKLQAEIDKEEIIARAEEEKIDEANIAWDDIQAKVDADYQLDERLQVKEQEQFTIEEKDTLFKKNS